jgi:hypothetical protein
MLDMIDSLDPHEQEAVEALVESLISGRQRSDG